MGLFRERKPLEFEIVTTKGGDTGKSALYSGEFLFKDTEIFDVIGNIDELNSLIGIVKKESFDTDVVATLHGTQGALYNIMATIATDKTYEEYTPITEESVNIIAIEHAMQRLMKKVDIEQRFVIPESWYDYVRTVTRRAERSLVKYIRNEPKPIKVDFSDLHHCQKYLNRLSDYLFVVARYIEEKAKLDTSNR